MQTDNTAQTVLIVDDIKSNVLTLAETLKDMCGVKVANNGSTALKIASMVPAPDLILLDIMMPDIDGYYVCEELKKNPLTRDIPVIFITAMDDEVNEARGLSLGAIDYISKPFNPALVKARVKNHLELKIYRDMLKEKTMIDGLTGVANRRRFDESLTAEWNRACRSGNEISLIMLDIDYFKNYNDTYGHLQGDDCLRAVAGSLVGLNRRSSDLVARWGGEEFACLLPDTSAEEASELAERLRKGIEDLKIEHRSSLVSGLVTVSLGVAAVKPEISQTSEILIEKADRALYKAKKSGRNRVSE